MEKITAIEELCTRDFDGFVIKTTAQNITLSISNGQNCCENWGYFLSEEDPRFFIGATLLGVKLTDDSLNPAAFNKSGVDPTSKYFSGGLMFVDIETDRGVLQFVAYNEHNGYYGHEASVKSVQLSHSECL